MRFSFAAAVALAGVVSAQKSKPPTAGFAPVSKPSRGEEVAAGSTYEIKWGVNASYPGTVTIALLGGVDSISLFDAGVIAEEVENSAGSFSWDVDEDLGDKATYGIQITYDLDEETYQLGFPFKIVGGTGGDDDDTTTATSSTRARSTTSAVTSAPSSSFSGNLSTTAGPSRTTVQTTTTGSSPSRTSTGTSAPTGGAASLSGSNVALFGGLAMAFFAL